MKKYLPALLAVLLAASCATVPPNQPATYWGAYLDPQAGVIGQMKLTGASEALAPLLADKDLKDVLARTSGIYFSLKLAKNESGKLKAGYRILALGDYPLGWTAFYLGIQSTWKKVSGPLEQFQNPLAGIFAVNAESGAVIASNEALPANLHQTAFSFPQVYLEGLEKWDLALLFPNPGESLLGDKIGRIIPVEFAQAVFQIKGKGFFGRIVLKMKDEKAARAGYLMVKLAMGAWLESVFDTGNSAKVSANEISKNLTYTVEGNSVIVDGFTLPFAWISDLAAGLLPKKDAK